MKERVEDLRKYVKYINETTFVIIFTIIMIVVVLIVTRLKKVTAELYEKENTAAVLKEYIQENDYPFDEMSQDWSAEDIEGFCYHDISEECVKAGGKFPVVMQMYTYIVCKKYNVDYEMVFALIEQESKCVFTASGDNGSSSGYMQIAKRWHLERMNRLGFTDLKNPYHNVVVGIDYIAELQERLKGIPEDIRPYYVLAAYNHGYDGAKKNLWDKGIYKYSYNEQIMARARELKQEKISQEGQKGE